MAKSVKVVLTLVDAQGIEWVATETTETKAKALVKAYTNAGLILTAKFSAVA
jgi:hypothetical protein